MINTYGFRNGALLTCLPLPFAKAEGKLHLCELAMMHYGEWVHIVSQSATTALSSGVSWSNMPSLLIGTSGWVYQHWRGLFYPPELPQAKWLPFYSERFNTVEINNSFYRLPSKAAFERWHRQTPNDFTFAVKGNRFITHMRKLRSVEEPLRRFFEAVCGLGEKAKVILWQLPPMLKADHERLREFLRVLPKGYRYAVEFRHPSWWIDRASIKVLEEFGCAFCIPSAPMLPKEIILTSDFSYIRMHGWNQLYSGCYPMSELRWWAERISEMLRNGIDVFVYFNNDVNAYAIRNAEELANLIRR